MKTNKVNFRELYQKLVYPRLIEEKMLLLLRQGKISKWFSGIGQEAISVGVASSLTPNDYILPLHRNLGVFTTRGVELTQLFAQFQGADSGFTKGRDRSFHFGSIEHRIVGMISHLGPQLCVADGIALAFKLKKEKNIVAVFSGDGGTSQGDFHEAINIASVWNLPVIFVIENNGYGLSTPTSEQFKCKQLSDRAVGYGIKGYTIDGNDILKVTTTMQKIAAEMRKKPAPVILECMTFRMRGHEEASGTKYVPKKLMEEWGKKDPVAKFENYLRTKKILSKAVQEAIKSEIKNKIEIAIENAFALPPPPVNTANEIADVYAPYTYIEVPASSTNIKKRFVDAVSDGLKESLKVHKNLVLMGQDIAQYGGVFKVTEGFLSEFGPERIRNTPLCESGVLGSGLGLSIHGFKSVIEMQFADFVTCGFNQIVNNIAKTHYRWGANADVVVRMPTGAGTGAGPFHSQSNEAWFFHVPGLKVVYPSTPYDAKGLLCEAINDPNPVIYFEHKLLYRSIQEEIPEGYYNIPIGKSRVVRDGGRICIITYGAGVHWAKDLANNNPEIDPYILDLRTLSPLDYASIQEAVERTGRVLILHEDNMTGGIGGEISAWISQNCFKSLDAPIMRCASLDTPIPFHPDLEKNYLARSRLLTTALELVSF